MNITTKSISRFAFLLAMLTVTISVQAARPVARWDVIPDQLITETFNVGVCAFHVEGVKVEFSVNGNLVHTAENPTYNDRTDVWEFWFALDPSQYADGPLTIDAKAICLNSVAANPAYDLPSLNLYANSGGTLGSDVMKWVDSVNGSDSNSGDETSPYATLAKGVSNTPPGGTVYLQAGTYSSQGLGGGSSRDYWTTISAAPGVDRDLVEVGPGRPSSQRMKWADLTLFCDSSSGGYTTILTGENGNHSVWVDGCKTLNKQGRWAASAQLFGNRYVSYVTNTLTTQMSNGPSGGILRNVTLDTITSDSWTGGNKLVVNCVVDGVDPGSTGAHPDFHQSYAVAPNWVENVILYNVKGYFCKSQGLFGSRLRNAAFVNIIYEKFDTVMYSQYSGPMENVMFMHMNFFNQSWLWRGSGSNVYTPTDVYLYNNIHSSMNFAEDAGPSSELIVDHCHFVSTSMGDNITTGDPLHVDPANRDYTLQPESPAYGTGRYLQCVPADMDGNPYNPDARNRGPYASGIAASPVRAKHIFYNNSSYDGNNAAANAADDSAIATGKVALESGDTATFANYTSYAKGINGIMVDILDTSGTLTAGDFSFKVGNDSNPSGWSTAPAPVSVTMRAAAGVDDSDRVTIIFADGAIKGQWLQVTVLANANTGLDTDVVFYFGNAAGESGNSETDAIVDASDEIAARNNPRHFVDPAALDNPNDHDRDMKVDATDQIISRNNVTDFTSSLKLITAP